MAQIQECAEKTLLQTAHSGQQQIRRELDALQHDQERFSSKLTVSSTINYVTPPGTMC